MTNSTAEKFKKNGYLYVKNFLSQEECQESVNRVYERIARNNHQDNPEDSLNHDDQCPKSWAIDGAKDGGILADIHHKKVPMLEQLTGMKLLPSYCYTRVYPPGEELKIHIDRFACEISVTITLRAVGGIWPIYFLGLEDSFNNISYYTKTGTMSPYEDLSNRVPFIIPEGDGVIYKGQRLFHWREPYVEGTEQIQTFFHYVQADGLYRDYNCS